MRKADELEYIGSCLNKARPDEIIFVLMARDAAAPAAVRAWAMERIKLGLNKSQDAKILEALKSATEMEEQKSAGAPHSFSSLEVQHG